MGGPTQSILLCICVCVSHFHSVSLLCFETMTYFFTNCSCWWVTVCSKLTHYLQSYCPLTFQISDMIFCGFQTLGHDNNGWQQKNFGTFVGRLLKVNQTVTTVFVYYLVETNISSCFLIEFPLQKNTIIFPSPCLAFSTNVHPLTHLKKIDSHNKTRLFTGQLIWDENKKGYLQ